MEIRLAIVMDVNPASYTADILISQESYYNGVPILNVYGPSYGQDITWLTNLRGAEVLVLDIANQLYILGSLPSQQVEANDNIAVGLTEDEYGGETPSTYKEAILRDFSNKRARDFLPGDKILRADEAEISAWREGVAKLKASPLAQFILGKFKDFGRLITRVFEHFSDFGEVLHTHNDQGRVGIHIKGGANYKEESHPEEAKWTVQSWIGDYPDDPDSRLYIRVNDKDNTEFVTLKFDIGGNLTLETSQDDTQDIGNDRTHNIVNDEAITVGGDAARNVTGNWDVHVKGEINITSDTVVNAKAPTINLN